MAALGGRGADAGFGVKPRENEEGRSGEAAPRSGAKRRPDFWRAALVVWFDAFDAVVNGSTADASFSLNIDSGDSIAERRSVEA